VREDGLTTFGAPTSTAAMPMRWTLDDYPYFEFLVSRNGVMPGLQNASHVIENWLDGFRSLQQGLDWGTIGYTCHPLVIGRRHRRLMLARFIDHLARAGAEFMTLETALQRFHAYRGP